MSIRYQDIYGDNEYGGNQLNRIAFINEKLKDGTYSYVNYFINDYEIIAARYALTNKWWLVPNASGSEFIEPIGPFPSAVKALVHLALIADSVTRED